MTRIVVVGDPFTGKSTLLEALSNRSSSPVSLAHLFPVSRAADGKFICFNDAQTQNELAMECVEGSSEMVQNALCVIVVFDLTRAETFNRTKIVYVPETSLMVNKTKSFFILVGNKSDQIERRQVLQDEAEKFAGDSGMFYVEVSGLFKRNIDIVQKIIRIRASFLLKTKLLPIASESQRSLQSSSEKMTKKPESFAGVQTTESKGRGLSAIDFQNIAPNDLRILKSEMKREILEQVAKHGQSPEHFFPLDHENKENIRFNPNTSSYSLRDQEIIQTQLYNSGQTQPGEKTQAIMLQQMNGLNDLRRDSYASGNSQNYPRNLRSSPPSHEQFQNHHENDMRISGINNGRTGITRREDPFGSAVLSQSTSAHSSKDSQFQRDQNAQRAQCEERQNGNNFQRGIRAGSHSRQNSVPISLKESAKIEGFKRSSQVAEREKDKRQFEAEIEELELSIKKMEESYKKTEEACFASKGNPHEEEELNEENNFMESIKKPKIRAKNNQYTFGKSNELGEMSKLDANLERMAYFSPPTLEEIHSSAFKPENQPLKQLQAAKNKEEPSQRSSLCEKSQSHAKENEEGFKVQFSISLADDLESISITLNDSSESLARKILTKGKRHGEIGEDEIKKLARAIEIESQAVFSLLKGAANPPKPVQKSSPVILGTKVFPRSLSSSSLSDRKTAVLPNGHGYSSLNDKKAPNSSKPVTPAQKGKSKEARPASKGKNQNQKPPLTKPFAKVDLSEGNQVKTCPNEEKEPHLVHTVDRDIVIGSLNIQLQDGSYKELLVRRNDKPEIVASSFLRSHALKQGYYEKLVQNIKEMKKSWAISQLPSQDSLDEPAPDPRPFKLLPHQPTASASPANSQTPLQSLAFPPKTIESSQPPVRKGSEPKQPVEMGPQSYRSNHSRRSSESNINSQKFFSWQGAQAPSPKVRIY